VTEITNEKVINDQFDLVIEPGKGFRHYWQVALEQYLAEKGPLFSTKY
jgi:hypothetical protein